MTLRTDVSVLYVDPRGPYPKLVADWWDERRDARLYAGPNPVVAHPPCGPWSKQRHNYRGNEHDCAARALAQVQFGGVLEHPAESKFWGAAGLPKPADFWSDYNGFTVEVEQVAWGHVARKRTWLYCYRVDRAFVASTMRAGGTPTHWLSGNRACKTGGSVPTGVRRRCYAEQTLMPGAFAEWLIELAAQARPAARPKLKHTCRADHPERDCEVCDLWPAEGEP